MKFNQVYQFTLPMPTFDNFSQQEVVEIYKNGSAFSHFIERWLAKKFPITHVKGCKEYDFTDNANPEIKYDAKTLTAGGCKYYPSSMIGTGRKFDQELFEQKANKLIYIIVSNILFPEIRVKFVTGFDLLIQYPNGVIPYADYGKFFEDDTFVPEKKPPKEKKTQTPRRVEEIRLKKLKKVGDLRKECMESGLHDKGKKSDLLERLLSMLSNKFGDDGQLKKTESIENVVLPIPSESGSELH